MTDYTEPYVETHHDLLITKPSKSYLKEIAKWSSFFAILGFIFVGLIVLGSIAVLTAGAHVFSGMNEATQLGVFSAISSTFLIGIYLLMGLLYFLPSYYLYISASNLKKGLKLNDSLLMEEGFSKLKSCFKFFGILTAIILTIYAIIFFFAFLTAAFF